MVITLEKGDMFELSMVSVICIVGKKDGSTFLMLKNGNVLIVPSEIATTRKLSELWDKNHITCLKDGDPSDETSDDFWERLESYRQ